MKGVSQVRVRLVTEYDQYRVVDTALSVPATLKRSGLSDVVNHLLGNDQTDAEADHSSGDYQKFDFAVNGVLIRTSIRQFIVQQQLNTEETIIIDYFPVVQFSSSEPPHIETPSWVGCIDSCHIPDTTGDGSKTGSYLLLAGCYDGALRFIRCDSSSSVNELVDIGSVAAHEDPIRSVNFISKKALLSSEEVEFGTIATASKDQSIKLWTLQPLLSATSTSSKRSTRKSSTTSSGSGGLLERCNAVCSAVLQGHYSSVESTAVWTASNDSADSEEVALLSGDWSGNLFCWDLSPTALNIARNENGNDSGSSSENLIKKQRISKEQSNASASAADVGPLILKNPMFTIKAHTQSISGISVSHSAAATAYTASWDHAVKQWDLLRQDCVLTMVCSKVATSLDTSSSSSGSTDSILTSHPDGKVRMWDTRAGSQAQQDIAAGGSSRSVYGRNGSAHWISQVRWRPTGAATSSASAVFAATDFDGVVSLWDTRATSMPLSRVEAHDGKALCCHWTTTDDTADATAISSVLTGGSDCTVVSSALVKQ